MHLTFAQKDIESPCQPRLMRAGRGLAEPRIGTPVCSGGSMAAAGSSGSGGSIDLGLRGSTVVITGAGSGIGAAAARLLGAAGASVVLVGRREALLRQCADAIGEAGGR